MPEPVVPVTPSTPTAPAPPGPPAVDPLWGMDAFAQTAQLTKPAVAALRRWMQARHLDPHGHYPVKTWREHLRGLMSHREVSA